MEKQLVLLVSEIGTGTAMPRRPSKQKVQERRCLVAVNKDAVIRLYGDKGVAAPVPFVEDAQIFIFILLNGKSLYFSSAKV